VSVEDQHDSGAALAQHYIRAWNERMTAAERSKAALLTGTLAVAVPLWIERYRHVDPEDAQRRSQVCLDVIASRGDQILYRSEKKGGTAVAFNHLAEALAILAFSPGGVTFAGQHWEAFRP
jgi:hypothetical protein